MRILWFSVTPVLSGMQLFNRSETYSGAGWIDSLLKAIPTNEDTLQICVCFQYWDKHGNVLQAKSQTQPGVCYVALPAATPYMDTVQEQQEKAFIEIYHQFQPDLVHIFGTETQIANRMLQLIGPDKVLLSLTGLISYCCCHYFGGIRNELDNRYTFRDVLKGSIHKGYRNFLQKGLIEQDTLQKALYVSGRTDWDRLGARLINPKLQYYFCNENLRDAFYDKKWHINHCERYTIFASSSASPLKGFHYLLEALPFVLRLYPETKVYVTGNLPCDDFRGKIRQTAYQKYMRKKIKQLNLEQAVCFVGILDEEQMAQRCVQSHVYVLASNIENSPNSLGEAMLMGVPSIASYVGGVPSMVTHEMDGLLYPCDEPYALAQQIIRIFGDDALAERLSVNAMVRAAERHHRQHNAETMVGIYQSICTHQQKISREEGQL